MSTAEPGIPTKYLETSSTKRLGSLPIWYVKLTQPQRDHIVVTRGICFGSTKRCWTLSFATGVAREVKWVTDPRGAAA